MSTILDDHIKNLPKEFYHGSEIRDNDGCTLAMLAVKKNCI